MAELYTSRGCCIEHENWAVSGRSGRATGGSVTKRSSCKGDQTSKTSRSVGLPIGCDTFNGTALARPARAVRCWLTMRRQRLLLVTRSLGFNDGLEAQSGRQINPTCERVVIPTPLPRLCVGAWAETGLTAAPASSPHVPNRASASGRGPPPSGTLLTVERANHTLARGRGARSALVADCHDTAGTTLTESLVATAVVFSSFAQRSNSCNYAAGTCTRHTRRSAPKRAANSASLSGSVVTGRARPPWSRTHAKRCRPSVNRMMPSLSTERWGIQTACPARMNSPILRYLVGMPTPDPPTPT